MNIEIYTEFEDEQEMADTLKHIAQLIEQGNTSGYYPTWKIVLN